MRIGVDMDGVLVNFLNSAYALMRVLFYKPENGVIQTSWGFDSLGLTAGEESVLWHTIDTLPNWWLSLKRLPNTDFIEVANKKHDVFFITNRKEAAGFPISDQTKIWIGENTGIVYPTVIVSKKKGEIARALDLDYFIDDKPENCIDVYSNSPNTKVYLQDGTYNQTCNHLGLVRVNSLNDFLCRIGAVQ